MILPPDEDEAERQRELARNEEILKSQERNKRKRDISTRIKKKQSPAQSVMSSPPYKPIPENLKKHFPEDHVLLGIKPDGACGVTCGAVHLFAQQNGGVEFRRHINKHIVAHWDYYRNKINFPYKRQVGVSGHFAEFNDPTEFQNFLLSSASDFLWSDSEEIQAICNMYQLRATVVKTPENKGDPPHHLSSRSRPGHPEAGPS